MNSPIIKTIDSKLGLLKIFNQDNLCEIKKENITLNNQILIPGQRTTLDNFFNGEVTYLGLHEDFMQFQIGEHQDLFSDEIWCNEFKKLDERHILTIYQVGTARDYIFKNGNWK